MAYIPIRLPQFRRGVVTCDVIKFALDPRLRDVHAMLRLPLVESGIEAACNFTIADSLFGIIEGVSAVFWPRDSNPTESFKRCVERYYPRDIEGPGGGVLPHCAAEVYAKFRSPMQHCLGLAIEGPDKQGIRVRAEWGRRLQVFRDRAPLSESELEEIETADPWPSNLGRVTLQDDGQNYILSVEAFYAGTRRLIENFLTDDSETEGAETFLQHTLGRPIWSGDTVTHSGVTATAVTSTTFDLRSGKV